MLIYKRDLDGIAEGVIWHQRLVMHINS